MENTNIIEGHKVRWYKKRWFKGIILVLVIIIVAGGTVLWKTGWTVSKISSGGLLNSLVHNLPGIEKKLKSQEDGRINVMLLGMRGQNVPGGGLLADTIMVVSIKPDQKEVSIVSIPRDLYVDNPGWGGKTKINAVYAAGQENGKNRGIDDMQKIVGDVSGLEIHYGATINFAGFKDLVNALGGIEVNLDQPFSEPLQFREPHVCDPYVFTVPTGEYQLKKNEKGKIVKRYPLCTNKDLECGGIFQLPAGKNLLDGDKALCFVRARVTSNDFERARRQQLVLQALKNKALSLGTLSDFGKVSGILDALEKNVRTNMEPWEMQEFFNLYSGMGDMNIVQKVLDNSEEGLLYAPAEDPAAGYILLPRGDNYERIHALFRDMLN